ncbi:MAG: tRNA dihydrouridine synthase DusB [Bacillota bacterium]
MIIKDKEIEPPIIVAPMAGITDYPYRQILREMGAKLIYSEMVSSKGLVYGSRRTKELLDYKIKDDGYINIQLFGEETEFIVKALKIVQKEYKPDFIDLNMGCPAPKVVKTGAGSALMKNPEKAKEILTAMVETADIPITLKIRSGWDKNSVNAVEIAKIADNAGVALIAVHGRTREQYYSGNVDYDIIKKVKEAINIPVIGSGDIYDISSAEKMFDRTGCDGIMAARGIQGNPWLIKRLKKYFRESIILDKPNVEQKIDMAIKHLKRAADYYGEEVAVPKMRKHISWYIKGMKNSTYVKDKINKLTNKKEIIDVLNEYKNILNKKQN